MYDKFIENLLREISCYRLNKIIGKTLEDYDVYYLDFLQRIAKFAELFLQKNFAILDKDLSLNDCQLNMLSSMEKILSDFFCSIDEDLGYRFANIMHEKFEVDESGIKETRVVFSVDGESYTDDHVYVRVDGTIKDFFVTAHEITHYFSRPYEQTSFVRYIFGESPSVSVEFLLYDYLVENYNDLSKDAYEYMHRRIQYLMKHGINVLIANDLVSLYKKYGKLNEAILYQYISKRSAMFSNSFNELFWNMVDTIIYEKRMVFDVDINYFSALFVAGDFRKRIRLDSKEKSKFMEFNDLLGKVDFEAEDVLHKLRQLRIPFVGPLKGKENFQPGVYYQCYFGGFVMPKEIDSNFIHIDEESVQYLLSIGDDLICEFLDDSRERER